MHHKGAIWLFHREQEVQELLSGGGRGAALYSDSESDQSFKVPELRHRPVYDAVGLLRTQDAERIYSSIGGGQVSVLPRTSRKAPRRALAPRQELAHAARRERKC